MNIRIGSVDIAQRLLNPAQLRLADEPYMPLWIQLLPRNGKAQLKWHVEPWCRWLKPVQFDTRQVVNGVSAALDKRKYPIKPSLSTRNAKRGAGLEAKFYQSNNVCDVKTAKLFVIRNV